MLFRDVGKAVGIGLAPTIGFLPDTINSALAPIRRSIKNAEKTNHAANIGLPGGKERKNMPIRGKKCGIWLTNNAAGQHIELPRRTVCRTDNPQFNPPPLINDMEPNIRLQPQDTYLLVSRLDQLIRVCSKISNMIMAIFIINIGIALIYFIAVVLMGIGAAAASR